MKRVDAVERDDYVSRTSALKDAIFSGDGGSAGDGRWRRDGRGGRAGRVHGQRGRGPRRLAGGPRVAQGVAPAGVAAGGPRGPAPARRPPRAQVPGALAGTGQ